MFRTSNCIESLLTLFGVVAIVFVQFKEGSYFQKHWTDFTCSRIPSLKSSLQVFEKTWTQVQQNRDVSKYLFGFLRTKECLLNWLLFPSGQDCQSLDIGLFGLDNFLNNQSFGSIVSESFTNDVNEAFDFLVNTSWLKYPKLLEHVGVTHRHSRFRSNKFCFISFSSGRVSVNIDMLNDRESSI